MSARIRLLRSICPVFLVLSGHAMGGCGDDGGSADPSAGTTEQVEDATTEGEATGTSPGTGSEESSSSGVATTSLPEGDCIAMDGDGPCMVESLMPLPSRSVAFGDFDDDGDLDALAQSDATDPPEIWLLQNDAGVFDEGTPLPFAPGLEDEGDPGSLGSIVAMRTTGGHRAVVQGTYGSLGAVRVDVWRSSVSDLSRLYGPTSSPPVGPWVGDFDGDGNDDLAFATMTNTLDALELRGCDAQGCDEGSVAMTQDAPAGPWTILGAEVTGDDREDLVVLTTDTGTTSVTVLESMGGGFNVGETSQLGTGLSPFFVRAADLNGDGLDDLIAVSDGGDGSSNEDSASMSLFSADGSGGFSATTTVDAPARITGLGFGDALGDGGTDVVVRVTDAPGVMVFSGPELGSSIVYELTTASTGQSGAAIGTWPTLVADVDGTGTTDIVTVVQQSGGFALSVLRSLPE